MRVRGVRARRIAAIASKEWREIVRDKLFFSLAFVVPTTLMLMFGHGLSFDVEDIPFAVIDYDRTALSRDYAYALIDSRYFDLKGYLTTPDEIFPLIADGKVRAVVIIPERFQARLLEGRSAAVQTVIDGTFPSRAETIKAYFIAINAATTREFLTTALGSARGIPAKRAGELLEPVRLEVRYLYNQSVKSIWSLAPKLIMALLMISPPFLTALGVVREKESGSIYNIYSSTATRLEFLVGKLSPYVGISLLNAAILFLLATLHFGAPFKGSLVFFLPVTALYLICTTGIGLVVSVLVQSQTSAMVATAIVTVVPSVLYSGVIVPISSLTEGAQVVARLLPAMYYSDIVIGVFLKDVGWHQLWPQVTVLFLYAVALFTVGYLMFHKRPSR